MDLDAVITTVLVAVIIVTPILCVIMFISNIRLKKKMERLLMSVDEMNARIEEVNRQNVSKISDELAKQRRMISDSLSAMNDNVTRGVINMSKGKAEK